MSLIHAAARERKGLLRIYRFIAIFGILLVLSRQFIDTDKTYIFFMWNFFLAGLPLIFSSIMIQMPGRGYHRNSMLAMGFLWLLFLPNAPYMLTDYIHVVHGDHRYFLLDAFTFCWFAIPAFIAAIISLNDISRLLMARYNHWLVSAMIFIVCLMCSFGIYLGRGLRFNSWDIVVKPAAIVTEAMVSLRNPYEDVHTWMRAMVIGLLMFLGYQAMKLVKSRV